MYHYTDSGLDNVRLDGGYTVHDTPHGEGVSIHDLEGLHKLIGQVIAQKTPALDGDDVRFLRKEMDLTQSALSALLRVSEDTIRNYENRTQIPESVELILRQLYLEHINGDGSLRDLVREISRLNREEHQRKFLYDHQSWEAA